MRIFLSFFLLIGCTQGPDDRTADDRTPLSAKCDDSDLNRCFLPWPSNRYTVADPTTQTGLRLAIDPAGLPIDDRVDYLNQADGYSRATGVAAAFVGAINTDALSWDPVDSLDRALQGVKVDPQILNFQNL